MDINICNLITITNQLFNTGRVQARTEEHIAAAFILGDMDYLPGGHHDVEEAWGLIGPELQERVTTIREEYMHMIDTGG